MLPTLGPFLPPSIACIHLLDYVDVWSALSICRICLLEVQKSSFSEHWPLYGELTLLLGKMLDVARYGPHGGKLCLLCQGSYVWSTQTKRNLRRDRHFIRNSNATDTSWLGSECVFGVKSRQCVETIITRRPSCRRIWFPYLSNMRYQRSFTAMYPSKQTNNIGSIYCKSRDRGNHLQLAAIPSRIKLD